jgi:hypothetical protein
LARGKLESLVDEQMVFAVPHTEYKLHLVPTVPAAEFDKYVGKRIGGVIEAVALRIHPAQAGGCFIEPVWGAPRIIAGKVCSVDEAERRVLVDPGVPMWVTAPAEQDLSALHEGQLVNFYVRSGTSFRPVLS